MDIGISRRSVLKAVGGGGACVATMAAGTAVAAYRRGLLSPSELSLIPRISEEVRVTDRAALGRDEILRQSSTPAPAARLLERRLSPGENLEGLGLDVHSVVAEFLCHPGRPNILLEGFERVSYEIVEVAWCPGSGWPVYRDRAPNSEPVFGMRYAGVPRHQIVFMDDRALYVGNPGAVGVISGIQGPLRVDVNGNTHQDHRGFFKVLITGLA